MTRTPRLVVLSATVLFASLGATAAQAAPSTSSLSAARTLANRQASAVGAALLAARTAARSTTDAAALQHRADPYLAQLATTQAAIRRARSATAVRTAARPLAGLPVPYQQLVAATWRSDAALLPQGAIGQLRLALGKVETRLELLAAQGTQSASANADLAAAAAALHRAEAAVRATDLALLGLRPGPDYSVRLLAVATRPEVRAAVAPGLAAVTRAEVTLRTAASTPVIHDGDVV